MSDREHPGLQRDTGERDPCRLLAAAGPRPPVPAERARRVRDAARAAWQETVARRRRGRRFAALAAAAGVLLGGLGLLAALRGVLPFVTHPVARVVRVEGAVRSTGARGAPVAAGQRLFGGTTLETGPRGGVALELAGGAGVRAAASTELRLVSAATLKLARGRVYVDTEGAKDSVRIRVGARTVTDIGTQFLVAAEDGGCRVWVRRGRVRVAGGPSGTQELSAGEALAERPGKQPRRERVAPSDPVWSWAERLAPPFAIEGAPLTAFLDWVGRETGLAIAYGTPETLAAARETTLHGSIEGLPPRDALDAVIRSTRFTARIGPRRIVVLPAPGTKLPAQ